MSGDDVVAAARLSVTGGKHPGNKHSGDANERAPALKWPENRIRVPLHAILLRLEPARALRAKLRKYTSDRSRIKENPATISSFRKGMSAFFASIGQVSGEDLTQRRFDFRNHTVPIARVSLPE